MHRQSSRAFIRVKIWMAVSDRVAGHDSHDYDFAPGWPDLVQSGKVFVDLAERCLQGTSSLKQHRTIAMLRRTL